MGDQDHGAAATETCDGFEDALLGVRVEAARGLVEKKDGLASGNCASKRDPLPLPAGHSASTRAEAGYSEGFHEMRRAYRLECRARRALGRPKANVGVQGIGE